MKDVIKQFKQWKKENPNKVYQYDCIFYFVERMGRGELLGFFEDVEDAIDSHWKQKEV